MRTEHAHRHPVPKLTTSAFLSALTTEDVLQPSKKFWDMYMDHIVTHDGGAVALFSIQLNLMAGTLAPFARKRPELRPLLEDVLAFRAS